MRSAYFAAAIVFLISNSVLADEVPQITPLSEEELIELMEGDTLRELERGEPLRAQVIGLIEAPVDELAEIIADYDNVLEWAPATREFEVIEQTGDGQFHIRGETALPVLRNRVWEMNSAYGFEEVDGVQAFVYTWDYIEESGNINDSFGYWLVFQHPEHPEWSYVKYVVNADPGVAIPDAIVRWATRNALPDLIRGLEERHDEVY